MSALSILLENLQTFIVDLALSISLIYLTNSLQYFIFRLRIIMHGFNSILTVVYLTERIEKTYVGYSK
jgi:hypothetical protein